jgi:hypothetical protein
MTQWILHHYPSSPFSEKVQDQVGGHASFFFLFSAASRGR